MIEMNESMKNDSMTGKKIFTSLTQAATISIMSVLLVSGCSQHKTHPDEKSAVTNAMNSNNMSGISVSQDQDKGVMTLTGDVQTQNQKTQAENLAKQAAPDYTVADEIGVRPANSASQAADVASASDDAIHDSFKAELKGHKNLDDQSIDYKVKNGTLMLSGSVKTEAQKKEAEKLAKHVPNVGQVVNEIKVEPKKHSTARSNESGL